MKARMKRFNIHLVDVPEEKNKEHEKVNLIIENS